MSKNESNSGKSGFVILEVICNTADVLKAGSGVLMLTVILLLTGIPAATPTETLRGGNVPEVGACELEGFKIAFAKPGTACLIQGSCVSMEACNTQGDELR